MPLPLPPSPFSTKCRLLSSWPALVEKGERVRGRGTIVSVCTKLCSMVAPNAFFIYTLFLVKSVCHNMVPISLRKIHDWAMHELSLSFIFFVLSSWWPWCPTHAPSPPPSPFSTKCRLLSSWPALVEKGEGEGKGHNCFCLHKTLYYGGPHMLSPTLFFLVISVWQNMAPIRLDQINGWAMQDFLLSFIRFFLS